MTHQPSGTHATLHPLRRKQHRILPPVFSRAEALMAICSPQAILRDEVE